MAIARKLSAGEAFYRLVDSVCSTNFTVAVRLSARLDGDALRNGLAAVQTRHPLLGVRISDEPRGPVFRTDGVGPIPVRVAQAAENAWIPYAEREINANFDLIRGPLVRCAVILHPDARSTLLLTFHHAVGDGISAGYLIRDLLRATGSSGTASAADVLPEPLDRRFEQRFKGVGGLSRYISEIARAGALVIRNRGLSAVNADRWAAYRNRRARAMPAIFSPSFTADLIARARAERTTVHGALAAAILMGARYEIRKEATALMALGSPVDLRARVDPPIGDTVGMFASVMGTLHRVGTGESFWGLARQIKEAIEAGFARGMHFSFEPMTFRILGPFARLAGRSEGGAMVFARLSAALFPSTGFGLTNIGRLDIEERYGNTSVLWVALLPSWSVFAHSGWSASTAAGRLTFNLVYMEPLLNRAHAKALAARTVGLLRESV